MLFQKRFWPGLADGSITLAFRRWKRATVKAGGTLRSPGGLLAIEAVERCALKDITAEDAGAAGYASKRELLDALKRREGALHRVRFAPAGADPRDALRRDDALSDEDRAANDAALDRSDQSAYAPWTRAVLGWIAEEPGRRAGDLAPRLGLPLKVFKQRVRRLKTLGLTESLKVGYRLSPRGRAYLAGHEAAVAAARRVRRS